MVVAALFAGNAFGFRDALMGSGVPAPAPAATSRFAGGPNSPATAPATVLRSQPWWQEVAAFSGTGPGTTPAFDITSGALQWRVTWSCRTGTLQVSPSPAQAHVKAMVDSPCPSGAAGYGVNTGKLTLRVSNPGAWHLVIAQQVDVPLDQAPSAAMIAPGSSVVASGTFYNVDQSASGTFKIYRLADKAYALRLSGFFVTPNVDLEVHLSPLAAPHSTGAYTGAPSVFVSYLDVTAGSLNFAIPGRVNPTKYHSVVLWCQLLHSVYGAAHLVPAAKPAHPAKAAHTAKPATAGPAAKAG